MWWYFLIAFILVVVITPAVKYLALRLGIVDKPDDERKKHLKPTPLLGGLAVFFVFWLVIGYLALFTHRLSGEIASAKLLGIFIASLIMVIVGVWDDVRNLPVKTRLVLVSLAILIVILSGLKLGGITNPFGGVIPLDWKTYDLGFLGNLVLIGDLFAFLWLFGITYTAKILDGLDGLTAGIIFIGSMMIYFLTQTEKFYQPEVGIIALVLAGVCLGFLIFNFYPAKIFLGESGGLFLGFLLGVLAIISGGKIATALLALAVPLLDLLRVIITRWRKGKKIFVGDREHLHFRLIDAGLSHRQAVLFFYFVASVFGITTLFLQSAMKLVTLLLLGVAMLAVGWWLNRIARVSKQN